MKDFKEDELIIYQNGDVFEIGKIKRLTETGAFVYYHSGDTASKTPFDCMHKLQNAYCIPFTILGGASNWIPCDSGEYPKNNDYVLISFSNLNITTIGRYEEDEDGGAFYLIDAEESCVSHNLFVNAWQPLPEPYKE